MKKTIKLSRYTPSIFQGRFDFNTPNAALTAEHPYESRILKILIMVLVACACLYLYFVSASVLNIMARREAMSQATSLEGKIGNLGEQYFALSKDVSPATGSSIGLSPIAQTSYVHRPGAAASNGAPAIASTNEI